MSHTGGRPGANEEPATPDNCLCPLRGGLRPEAQRPHRPDLQRGLPDGPLPTEVPDWEDARRDHRGRHLCHLRGGLHVRPPPPSPHPLLRLPAVMPVRRGTGQGSVHPPAESWRSQPGWTLPVSLALRSPACAVGCPRPLVLPNTALFRCNALTRSFWSRRWESNPRPDDYKSSALPTAPHRRGAGICPEPGPSYDCFLPTPGPCLRTTRVPACRPPTETLASASAGWQAGVQWPTLLNTVDDRQVAQAGGAEGSRWSGPSWSSFSSSW